MDGPSTTAPYIDTDTANMFRHSTLLADGHGAVSRCSLMISGLGYYRAWLNGEILDDHELGESHQFQARLPYDSLDCTALARANRTVDRINGRSRARNVTLAVELGRGWYGEQQLHPLGNVPLGARMLRALLTLTFDDGTKQYVTTQLAGWRRGHGPIIDDELHLGIVYDARKEVPGWQQPGFDDSAWIEPRVVNLSANGGHLARSQMVASVHPRIRRIRTIYPKAVHTLAATRWVVDIGENFAGWCQYRFATPPSAGTNLTFLHAERCNANGTITHEIQPIVADTFEITKFIFGNTPSAVFEPRFVSYGFRYVSY